MSKKKEQQRREYEENIYRVLQYRFSAIRAELHEASGRELTPVEKKVQEIEDYLFNLHLAVCRDRELEDRDDYERIPKR